MKETQNGTDTDTETGTARSADANANNADTNTAFAADTTTTFATAEVIDPISSIEWRDAASLNANDYNPNVVFNPELRLLERSILVTGWVQPILITKDGTIIDGFHRVQLALDSQPLMARYGGKVPCAIIDLPRDRAMMLTIRMNRAKGTHVAVRMSEIVHELLDKFQCDPQEIAIEIGATKDEIDLLYQDSVFKMKNIENYRYSRAWYPAEV